MQVLKLQGGFYEMPDIEFDAQTCVNLIPEADESGDGKGASIRLTSAPGLERFFYYNNFLIRGLCYLQVGYYIAVMFDTVNGVNMIYAINKLGQAYKLQRTDSYPNAPITSQVDHWTSSEADIKARSIRFAFDGTNLAIVDSGFYKVRVNISGTSPSAWYWDTIKDALGADLFKATDVAFCSGYFVFTEAAPNAYTAVPDKFWWTELYSTVLEGANVATSEYRNDGNVATAVLGNVLWLFGAKSTEVWGLSGDADLPFQRIPGAVNDVGLLDIKTLQQVADSFMWVALTAEHAPIIVMSQGYSAIKISTVAIDYKLETVTDWSACTSFVYAYAGHIYYGVNIPELSTTFVYDVATKLWHERKMYQANSLSLRSVDYCTSSPGFNTGLVTYIKDTPWIYKLTPDKPTVYPYDFPEGQVTYFERSFPTVSELGNRRIKHLSFELEANITQSSDARMTLQWTDDKGYTFNDGETLDAPGVGVYDYRYIWRRLGMARSRIYKLSFTSGNNVSLQTVTLNAEVTNG